MKSIYLLNAKKELELGKYDAALNFIISGANAADEACLFVKYYLSTEVKYSEKISYFENHFNSFNLGFSFDYFVQEIVGIFSPYRKEYSITNNIPLKEISNLALTDWILINKFNISKSYLEKFWKNCEKEILIDKLKKLISTVLMFDPKTK